MPPTSRKKTTRILWSSTPAVLSTTQSRSRSTPFSATVDAKEEGIVEKVYVTGCLSQRYGAELEKEIPDVDAWFGTRDLSRLLKTLNADYKQELVGERILTNPSHFCIPEDCRRLRQTLLILRDTVDARKHISASYRRARERSEESCERRNERVVADRTGFDFTTVSIFIRKEILQS